MRKLKILIIQITIFFLFSGYSLKAVENKILFKINNEIITSIDIYNEVKYLKIMNKEILNLEEEKIYEIAKNSLVKDKIKEIEVLKKYKKINLKNKFLDQTILNYHSKLGLKSLDEIDKFLNKNNLDIKNIKYRIAILSYWNNLIYSIYSNKVRIDKKEIEREIIENNLGKTKDYLLSEIVFNIEDKEIINNTIDKIKQSIKNEGFENTVLIYSIAESSRNKGLIGWVNENSLSKKIKEEISRLEINEFTNPIKIPSGYLILKLNDVKENKIKLNLEEKVKQVINEKTNEQLNNYSNIYFNKIKKSTQIENI
tara:strand:- start:749 stop:1684 length:936 start_codon:yes stop_codon:yes gene_type:complete